MKPLNLIILGPQGSGKGTQAQLLKDKLGMVVIGAGDSLREIAKTDTDLGRQVHQIINIQGKLAPPEVISSVIAEKLKSIPADTGVVIEGYPRSAEQYKLMKEFWPNLHRGDLTVLVVELSEAEALRRMQGRGRIDDRPDAIKTRLELYNSLTLPMIAEMEKDGIRVIHIDGAPSIEEVHGEIIKKLKLR